MTRTALAGFGTNSGNISVTKVATPEGPIYQFTLFTITDFITFPMPYDGKISYVAGRYSTVAAWTPTCDMSLYVAVAIAPKDSNTFTIIPESKALAPAYKDGVRTVDREVRTGIAQGLNVKVKQGENIALVAGYDNSNGTLNHTLPFNFTGSIVIEKT